MNSKLDMIDFGLNMVNFQLEASISGVQTSIVKASMTEYVLETIFTSTEVIIDAIVAVFSKAI